ncbi:MAG: transglutaminase-like cysteine peptidase [Pseudomonadota bacterium]
MTATQISILISSFTLIIISLSSIHASSYDFSKLKNLANQRYGQEAQQNVQELNLLIQNSQTASDAEKLKKINDFFNHKIRFMDDVELWGETDYWATPLESIGRQAGDCEDFTIAKYVFLKALNVDNNRMRLTYVRAYILNDGRHTTVAHMVLSYYQTPQSEPLILDNLIPEIMPASSRKDLSPIFSFNDKGLWVGSNSNPRTESQSSLSRWRDVLSRIKADGIE